MAIGSKHSNYAFFMILLFVIRMCSLIVKLVRNVKKGKIGRGWSIFAVTAGTVNSSIAAAVRNRQMFDLFV